MKSKPWQPLKPGDCVQVIAPAGKIDNWSTIESKIRTFLSSWQLNAEISSCLNEGDPLFPSIANTEEFRYQDFKKAILNPKIKAIWCVRGGYGCYSLLQRLCNEIDFTSSLPSPKLFIGFSDITLLLIAMNIRYRWNVIHGPMLAQIIEQKVSPTDIEVLKNIMFGKTPYIMWPDLIPLNNMAKQPRIISSSFIGGNFTIISRLYRLSSPLDILHTKNKILFIEDIGEPSRKIDGMWRQFIYSGYLKKRHAPSAIILGDFIHQDPQQKAEIEASLHLFSQMAELRQIPVFSFPSISHGYRNTPVPIGTRVTLECGEKTIIKIASGAKIKNI